MIPPVVAELRANFGQFRASVREARTEWGKTTTAIRGTTEANLEAGGQMERLSAHTAHGAESMAGLREQSTAAMTSIRGGLASVIPGLGELAETISLSREQWREQKAAATEALTVATQRAQALKVEIGRLDIALEATQTRMLELVPGSRGFDVANAKAVALMDRIAALNAELATTNAEIKRSGAAATLGGTAGRVRSAAKMIVGGGAIAGAFVGYEGIKEATKEEAAQAILRTAIEKTKHSLEEYEPALKSVQAQVRKWGFADDEATQSAARLTQMLHNPAKALNLVGLAANLARARNLDLATATNIVGKAATGHVAMLARYGFQTKDAAGHTLSARAAIEKMGETFGGTAEQYSHTLRGQLAAFRAQLDNLLERIGTWLIPRLTELGARFGELAGWINKHVVPTFKALYGEYERHRTLVKAVAVGVVAMVAAYKTFQVVKGIINAVRAAQIALNLAMASNPIGVIVLALVGLAAAFVYAWKHSETFRNVVKGAWEAVEKAAGKAVQFTINYALRPLVTAYLWMARQVVGAVDHAFGWIPKLGPMLHRAKAAVDEFARDTDATLKSWAESAAQWGGDATHAISKNAEAQAAVVSAQRNLMLALQTDDPRRIAVAKAALDSARRYAAQVAAEMKKKKVSDKTHGEAYAEGFNIGDAYGAGLSDAVATHEKKRKAKKKKSAKDAVKDAVAEARRKAAEQLAAALFAADKAKRAMQLAMQRQLDGVKEDLRRAQVELKLAGKGQGDLSIVNGAALNAGTSFAQLSRQANQKTEVTIHAGGVFMDVATLSRLMADALRGDGRRNISVGLA